MSIEHKAYRFAYRQFAAELLPALEGALVSQNPATLVRFIETHRASLRHPDEGTPLEDEWNKLIERGDPHEDMDDAAGSLEKLMELAARDQAAGLEDAPWPPHFRKMEGEAPRALAPGRSSQSGCHVPSPPLPPQP